MASVGFTIFGRPVKHEYLSNGLFNELGLNNESYLDESIDLKPGQSLAIIRRFRDKNNIEVVVVFSYVYAESYNGRAGGFLGSGIAFIGKPSKKLIVDKFKEIIKQSFSLINRESAKFIEPNINENKLKLPNPIEEGLLDDNRPKKYAIKNDISIGVKIEGNYFENLLACIQGFVYNESFFGVKVAYITNSTELFKSKVNPKYIYALHHLLDFSTVFRNNTAKIEEQKINFEKSIKSKEEHLSNYEKQLKHDRQTLLSKERDLEEKKQAIEVEVKENENIIITLKNNIEELKEKEREQKSRVSSMKSEVENAKKQLNEIQRKKNQSFKSIIEGNSYEKEVQDFKNLIIENYEIKKEENRRFDWFKLGLLVSVFILFFTTLFFGYYFIYPSKTNKSIVKENIEKPQKEIRLALEFKTPEEIHVNEFLALNNTSVEMHKAQLDKSIDLLNDDKYKSSFINYGIISNRNWNFREVLENNNPGDIDTGLDRLRRIKKMPNIKDTTLFYNKYLIKEIDENHTNIDTTTLVDYDSSASAILKAYLQNENNIYKGFGIEYKNPEDGRNFQDTDPVLLMHFRWMMFHFNDKFDIEKINNKNKKELKAPILKTE